MFDTDAYPKGAFLEDAANAQLIAKAPNLLAALKSFPQPGLPGKDNWQEKVIAWWNTTARAAISETEINP